MRHDTALVYATDDRYAGIMGTSLLSALEQADSLADTDVYILTCGLSAANVMRLEPLMRSHGHAPAHLVPMPDVERLAGTRLGRERGSLATYGRLLIGSALPDTVERAVYLDCDTLCFTSPAALLGVDLQGKTVAAVEDAWAAGYRRPLDLPASEPLWNAGVLSIDVARWRAIRGARSADEGPAWGDGPTTMPRCFPATTRR